MSPRSPLTKALTCIARTTLVLASIWFSPYDAHATERDTWTFLPDSSVFAPLLAHPQEPHVGIRLTLGSPRLKLDIGAAFDLVEFSPSQHDRFALQALLFTYALTTSNEGLRLQVDAVDGFFGGALFYRHEGTAHGWTIRLRILHRSAHFVDGHIDPSTGEWIDNKAPIPFTSDFGELLGALSWNPFHLAVSAYAGISYSTLIRPATIERFGALTGIEMRTPDTWWTLFGHPLTAYAAYDLTLTGIPEYVGTSIVQAGVRFGGWSGDGIRLYLEYHNGLEVFGQYYDTRTTAWGAGFAFDLW